MVPFGVYLLAESPHSSGCSRWSWLASPRLPLSPESGYATRLQDQAVWQASDTILESVVFALIGLQATAIVRAAGAGVDLIGYGLVVTAAAVLARPVWVFPATYLPRALFRGTRKNDPYPPWQVPAVISWTGMRGVVTLAAAFVIPPTVPERETLVFLAFFVTVATLMLHGLTLPMVIRLLGVRETVSITDMLAEAQAQQAAAQAGIARLEELTADDSEDTARARRDEARHWCADASQLARSIGRRGRGQGGAKRGLPAPAPRILRTTRTGSSRSGIRRDRRRRAAPGDARLGLEERP